MKNLFDTLEKFNKLIAGLSVVLLLISYFILSSSYSQFGIDAFQYFNGSEILIASIKNLTYLLRLFILPILLLWAIIGSTKALNEEEKALKILILSKKLFLKTFLITLVILIFKLIIYKYSNQEWMKLLSSAILNEVHILMCLFYFVLVYYESYSPYHKASRFVLTFIFLSSIIILFVLQISIVNREKKRIIFGTKNTYPLELYFNDSLKVSTNDSIRFIGKSNDYWYLININQKKTIIYPNSEIKKVVIPMKE